jgi:DNA repair exonuclease SbcCD ATPase subunit
MAPEIDLIVEMLRELKRANSNSSDSFDKLLTSLSKKIDTIDRNTAATELIKGYLTDLAKSSEEKYAATIAKFTDIEKAIKAIFIEQDEHAKNSNLQELVDVFSKNMNNLYSEARQQKTVLDAIENKITDISSDKTDKEDIIRTITLLRKDFENLNNSYKSIIDGINNELKNILSNIIKLDQTTINTQISSQLELVSRATNDIINYLETMDKRDTYLEKLLQNVATSESLKLTKEVVDSIIDRTDDITNKFNNLANKSDINKLEDSTNLLAEKIEETATKELFAQLSATTNSLISDADNIKQTLAKVTTNMDSLADTQTLENSLQQVFNKLKTLTKDIERTNAKQDILDLGNKLETLSLEFSTIKNIIIDLNDVINSKISTAISDISFEQECYEIKTHISKMLAMLPQKDDIERLLEDNELGNNLIQDIIKKTDILADKLDNLPTHADMDSLNNNQLSLVENLQVVASKDDIESVLKQNEKIDNKLSKLNFDNEFEHIYDKSASIENWLINSNIKENTKEIVNQLPNKAEQKEMLAVMQTLVKMADDIDELSKNVDVKKVNRTVAEVYQLIEDLKNDFINTTEMHNDSVIVNLSELQKSISSVVTEEEFNNFTEDLKEFVQKTIDDNNSINENISEIKDSQQAVIDNSIETSDTIVNKVENLNKQIDTLKTNIQSLPSTDHSEVLSNLTTKIEDLDKQLISISDNINSLPSADNSEVLSNLTTKIENLDKQLISISDNINSLPSSDNSEVLNDITIKIEDLDKQLISISDNINSLPSADNSEVLSNLTTKIEDLDKQLISISDNINYLPSSDNSEVLNDITTKIENLDKQLISISDNINSLPSADNSEVLSNLTTKIEDLDKQLISISDNINSLPSADNSEVLNDITIKIEDLDKQLISISDNINSLPSADNSEVLNGITTKIEDLDKQLISISDNINTLPSADNSEVLNNLTTKIDKLDNQILELSEYLSNTKNSNNGDFLNKINEIKEILNAKNLELSKIENFNNEISTSIEDFSNDIKNLIKNNNSDNSTSEKVENINESLKLLLATNENSFADIIEALNKYSKLQEEAPSTLLQNEMANTLAEIIELKERIIALANTFNDLSFPTTQQENDISYFISSKLEELGLDMENLNDSVGSQFQAGFAYNAELLEEKATTISELIKELRHENTGNIEFYEKLTSADNKILDVIQEIQLINTDIITNINNKNASLLQEILPLKEAIAELSGTDISSTNSTIKEKLDELHTMILENVLELSNNKSSEIIDKIEDSYINISNQISDCENNLRDFMMSDIDSVLIKIDSLKTEIEESINNFVPPDASQMKEFNEFLKQINEFKLNLNSNFSDLAEDLKNSLDEQIENKHQELKSMLAVAFNNNDILNAIEDLKNSFNMGAFKLENSENEKIDQDEDFDFNDFDKEFEQDNSIEVLTGLKEDFNHFSTVIKTLSEQNTDIENVLNSIQDKMNSLTLKNIEESSKKQLIGKGDFDFLEALNCLKSDVQSLHNNMDNILPKEEQIELSNILKHSEEITNSTAIEDLSKKIESLSNKISTNDWLEEIKTYLANDEIKTLLEGINKKIEILTLTDKSEWINEIKKSLEGINAIDIQFGESTNEIQAQLNLINDKIDILAQTSIATDSIQLEELQNSLNNIETKIDIIAATDTSADFDDIKYSLDNIEQKINTNSEDIPVTEILEAINHKIDLISQADSDNLTQNLDDIKALLVEQSNYINNFEDNKKTEAIKKCLNELSNDVNNLNNQNSDEIQKTIRDMKESIMAAVVTILDQVSFIEETEEIKDFVEEKTSEINQNLIEVTKQLKQITNANEAPDYTYSMQDIESDLAKLRIALNEIQEKDKNNQTEELSSILENINKIGNNFDELQNSLTKEEIFGLKNKFAQINSDILNLSDITNQLIIKSGESYCALNTMFEDFSKLITDQFSLKVDTMTNLLEKSNASDTVMRQALIYMGEWIDSASESMNKISTNSEEIIDIKSAIEGLKKSAPQQTEILNSIEEKFDEQQERLSYFEKQISKLSSIEEQFIEQQERIDRLEMSLEKILSAVEDIDDSKVTRKIDKIDKQIAKLSTNIEKLTSYVD